MAEHKDKNPDDDPAETDIPVSFYIGDNHATFRQMVDLARSIDTLFRLDGIELFGRSSVSERPFPAASLPISKNVNKTEVLAVINSLVKPENRQGVIDQLDAMYPTADWGDDYPAQGALDAILTALEADNPTEQVADDDEL